MKSVVIIPTLGRAGLVTRLLGHLRGQSRPPDEVVVSAVDGAEIDGVEIKGAEIDRTSDHPFPVTYLFGSKGLCAQRNRALEAVLGRFDVITFFDDDFIPADDYLARLVAAMQAHPDWSVVMGRVLHDGIAGTGLSFEEGLRLLRAAAPPPTTPTVRRRTGAYGCNMSLRAGAVGDLRFDERLVLYGWQEDIDFTHQLWRQGAVVQIDTLTGVHLGHKGGRISGLRTGYSQIVNPAYLIAKGTVPRLFACELMARNFAANLLRSLRPEAHIDRRGRLRGNLLGLRHVASGRLEPEHILNL